MSFRGEDEKEIMESNDQIQNNTEAQRFELQLGAYLAELRYRMNGDQIVYHHTQVPEALAGQGIGSRLAKHALEYARKQGLGVVVECPFVRGYLQRHPEYQDMVQEMRSDE